MRLDHKGGEKVFSDFAGKKLRYIDKDGVVHPASVFVCAMGASSYFFAQAFDDETSESWVHGHVDAFNFFGGAPEIIVPDNPRAVITTPSKYEPVVNRSFLKMANHYSCAVIPARPRESKDKAKVESAVGVVTRWIIARLRNRDFFSLYELNLAIRDLLDDANSRPFKKLPGSRKSAFESVDRPALQPLPVHQYEFAEYRKARVGIDYHVEFDGHWYSCPFQLAKQEVELRVTNTTVEIIYKNSRISSHARKYDKGRHTTIFEHMPTNHQEYAKWSPERLESWAATCGEGVQNLIASILAKKEHPALGFRACLGILNLGKEYGHERLNQACWRALAINTSSVSSLRSILKTGLDQRPVQSEDDPKQLKIAQHQNLRGSNYFFATEDLNAFSTNN